ncbi:MAG: family 20 glycosylhydrolase [Pseudorhodobacter sp.]|nr:family 20 glycosylhydrolase [Pseudorhodobacter sp.]
MTPRFSARIDGAQIHCEIGSDTALAAPVLCFSLMAPVRVVCGGTLLRSVAGYAEVALPDLVPGRAAQLVLEHADPAFRPANRAWLPRGAYLRVGARTLPLPALRAGPQSDTPPRMTPDFAGLRLIPQPESWQPAPGSLAAPSFACDHPAFAAVDALARRLGLAPLLAAEGVAVRLEHDPRHGDEGYGLRIGDAVTVRSGTLAGTTNAAVTLLNLRETYAARLPCGTVTDAPRFGWRGQHLDCARHFYRPETLHRLLDLMALFKLNRFHWHFADDEAFRLQIDCAPELWRLTAFRGEGCAVPGVFGGGIRAGGSYAKADARALITHAATLNIAILPEIEVPAHAFALNRAHPGLRDPGDRGEEASIQGYGENIVNPAMAATWDLLTPLASEVAALFPIGMLHLGCDELPPGAWNGSPAVAALKLAEGLTDSDDVQGWMMAKLAADLARQGIRAAAWEEAAKGANGGIGTDALLFSWTGQGPGIAAARRGHEVVMCPAQNVYFDMAHSADPDDWGSSWAAVVALEDVVNWRPVPAGAEDVTDKIVGVEGCFWSEFTCEDAEMEPMLAPRILGLANKAWDRNDSLTGTALRALAQVYGPLFDRIGWNRHRGA